MLWEGTCCGGDATGGGSGTRTLSGCPRPAQPAATLALPRVGREHCGTGSPLLWGLPPRPTPPGPISHPIRLPVPLRRCSLFPIEVPRHRHSLSKWETSPSPPSALGGKKKATREERNKQTNPFPLLAWHLLAALPLLIREAAGIISNKPLLMKFRAADPGGAPRHCFSQTLIKFTALRCSRLGWRQSGEAATAVLVVGSG